jgi:hypothetical protein
MQIRLRFQRCTPPSLTIPGVRWNDLVSYRNITSCVQILTKDAELQSLAGLLNFDYTNGLSPKVPIELIIAL